MQNAPAVKVGDRVRVVLEGEADDLDSLRHEFRVGTPFNGNYITATADHVVSIEVLPKPAEVGDLLETAAELRALPEGSVVRKRGRSYMPVYKSGSQWYTCQTSAALNVLNVADLLPVEVLAVGYAER